MSARAAKSLSKTASNRSLSHERRIEVTLYRASPTAALFPSFSAHQDLTSRQQLLSSSTESLLRNLSKVEECEQALRDAVQRLTEELQTTLRKTVEKLQNVRNDLQQRIHEATEEVATALSEDRPVLRSGIANAMWNGDDLTLFSYQVNSRTISDDIEKLMEIKVRELKDKELPVVQLEQDWKPESVTAKSWDTLETVPDCMSAEAKVTQSRLAQFRYQFEVNGGEAKGPIELTDGSIYIGEWRNGKRFGRGKQFTPAGGYLEGYWNNGLHLRGRYIYPSGDYYDGGFCHMKRDGCGSFQSFDEKTSYKGMWANGMKHGKGVETLPDGSTYIGDFRKDRKHGKGHFRWSNGEYYEGDFRDQMIDGVGKYVWSELKWYEGEWRQGKMHGKGHQLNDGREYQGEFVMDRKQGFGVMKWDGNVYEGEWADGQMHGRGFLTLKNRERKHCVFHHNKKVEEIA